MKETKEDLSKWTDGSRARTGRPNIVRMLVIPNLSIGLMRWVKTPVSYFVGINELSLTFTRRGKKTQNSERNIREPVWRADTAPRQDSL